MGTLLHLQELHTRSYRRRSRETEEEGDDKRKNGQTTPEVDGPVIHHIPERGREPREQVGREYRNTPLGQSSLRIYIHTQHTHSYFQCSFLYSLECRFIYNFLYLQKSGQLIQLAVALHHSVISDVAQYDRLTPMLCPCPITATLINPGVGPCPSVLIILRQSRLHAHSPANLVKTMGDLRTIHL